MNVNLDVLELIFALLDGSDLVASALVSRSFLAGAIPSIYAHIDYTSRHAKRNHQVMSPFATLAAHDHLVVHVKRITVHAAPVHQPPASRQVSPLFLRDLAHALRAATNLHAFVCTVKILPPLLPPLLDKHRLSHLRICASLGTRQTVILQERTGLQSLSLDFPSWNVIDILPKWTAAMQRTLAHLTLFMSQDLDATVLNNTLAQLPRLRGLHVIGCPRITHINVLKALSHTPDLRELSFTIFPSQENVLPPLNFPTPPLTHLSIDIRASYPSLKSLISRIISRLSPRDALAICGGWIGEIKGSSERNDAPQDAAVNDPGAAVGEGGGGGGQTFHVWQGPVHLHGPIPGHGHVHDQANDLPLLTPPNPHGNVNQNQPAAPHPPNQGSPVPLPHLMGFPFPFPLANPNGNNGPPNPDPNPDPNWPSLISSFPPTLSVLHLPQISPAGLKEVVDRCVGIQLLGIVIGNAFATLASIKASRSSGRSVGRTKSLTSKTVRPEVNELANVLSHARVLRELIIDAGAPDAPGNGTGSGSSDTRSGGSHTALLTAVSVRMLMQESPCLRRIVGEGRVWESPTPTPPLPLPHCLAIKLTFTKSRYGSGTGSNHAHGPPGFGSHGGGYGQVEASTHHWFWLTETASGGRIHSRF